MAVAVAVAVAAVAVAVAVVWLRLWQSSLRGKSGASEVHFRSGASLWRFGGTLNVALSSQRQCLV